jgi:hypothetical protein
MSKPGSHIGVVTNIVGSSGPPTPVESLPKSGGNWQAVSVSGHSAPLYYRTNDESGASLGFDLEQSRRLKYPIYVETAVGQLRRVRIPRIGRVVGLRRRADGTLRVELSSNAQMLTVAPTAPDAARITQVCQISLDEHRGVVIVNDGRSGAILDADLAVGPSIAWVPPPPVRQPGTLIESLPAATRPQIEEVFADLWKKTCDLSLTKDQIVGSECIAYNAPNGWCHVLAEATCRHLDSLHIQSQKAWLFGNLRLRTRNSPNCYFDCYWHVAAAVRVSEGSGWRAYVIDPIACDSPLTYDAWLSLFGNQVSARAWTDESTYTLDSSNHGIAVTADQFRKDLENIRWVVTAGPRPPFAC